MFIRLNKKIYPVATILNSGRKPSEKAALSSRKTWIFSDSRRFKPGTHHGIVLVRLHAPSRSRLAERLDEVFQREAVNEWPRCFVVVTDQKIRGRRPPNPQS